jgi:hypothetical protein
MNRSILIVICDFLLVSLLAFSTVDINKVGQNGTPQFKMTTPTVSPVTSRQDLGDVMRQALDEERKNRDLLTGELTRVKSVASQRDQQLQEKEQQLQQQNQQIQSIRSQLQSKEQLAAQLVETQSNLQRQFAAAQTNLAGLNEQLHATTVESILTKEQRAAMEEEARRQSAKAAALEQQLALVQKTNESLLTDQQTLNNQLLLSQASNHSATAQMLQLQDEVEAQRRENVRLAEGVKALAAKSSDLANEIHVSRPLAPNAIFEELSTNRVLATFGGVKPGLFGSDSKVREARTILVTDDTNTFALCHVQDTPLTLGAPGTQWEELKGTLAHGSAAFPIESLSFSFTDPRVVFIPVPAAEARALGSKVYHLSKDPYVFQDAVVVGTREDYYGECKFQIDMTAPNYLKMDHNSLKGLFGKFNPSSGDLVFSKTGQLLGVMANDSYCAMVRNFELVSTLRFGPPGRNQPTAHALEALYTVVAGLPYKLQ